MRENLKISFTHSRSWISISTPIISRSSSSHLSDPISPSHTEASHLHLPHAAPHHHLSSLPHNPPTPASTILTTITIFPPSDLSLATTHLRLHPIIISHLRTHPSSSQNPPQALLLHHRFPRSQNPVHDHLIIKEPISISRRPSPLHPVPIALFLIPYNPSPPGSIFFPADHHYHLLLKKSHATRTHRPPSSST
ncbi:hypothetical protein MRB53_016578 [Persea americana]|uniref:Uncharacterized protein n=1 Tax=Persea americana TaxID=3435 RepID=A0ACC2M3I8_PERAE|nr:hypothetical protein MRB53_016578 [Persea americana]